jgi:hypothetical protein
MIGITAVFGAPALMKPKTAFPLGRSDIAAARSPLYPGISVARQLRYDNILGKPRCRLQPILKAPLAAPRYRS